MANVNELEKAIDEFRTRRGGTPAALYVEPITRANTDFTDLKVFGIPVKVSVACRIGYYYLVDAEEDEELQERERVRAAKVKEHKDNLTRMAGEELSGGE